MSEDENGDLEKLAEEIAAERRKKFEQLDPSLRAVAESKPVTPPKVEQKRESVRGVPDDDLTQAASEVIIHFVDNFDQLNAATKAEAEAKFLNLVRDVWGKFVYGAKTKRGEVIEGGKGKDADVKVSLWLLERAGIQAAAEAEPIPQGSMMPGAFNIDTSGKSGLFVHRDMKQPAYKAFNLPERPATGVDNHPRWRETPTSSAKVLFEVLKKLGFLQETFGPGKKSREQQVTGRALEFMVDYSVDDDNAAFPASKDGAFADFNNSFQTLRGLGRYMTANQLFDYFKRYGQGGMYIESYREALHRPFTREDIKRYRLNEGPLDKSTGRKLKSPVEDMKESVAQARQVLKKPFHELGAEEREELYKAGKIMDTRFGRYVVNILQRKNDRLRAGHDAALAYGYDGMIIYDRQKHFFLVNTFNYKVDFSKDELMRRIPQATIVRGNILIKSGAAGADLQVRFADIFEAVKKSGARPSGEILSYLQLEQFVEDGVETAFKNEYKANLKKAVLDSLAAEGRSITGKEVQLELYLESKAGEYFENLAASADKMAQMRELIRSQYHLHAGELPPDLAVSKTPSRNGTIAPEIKAEFDEAAEKAMNTDAVTEVAIAHRHEIRRYEEIFVQVWKEFIARSSPEAYAVFSGITLDGKFIRKDGSISDKGIKPALLEQLRAEAQRRKLPEGPIVRSAAVPMGGTVSVAEPIVPRRDKLPRRGPDDETIEKKIRAAQAVVRQSKAIPPKESKPVPPRETKSVSKKLTVPVPQEAQPPAEEPKWSIAMLDEVFLPLIKINKDAQAALDRDDQVAFEALQTRIEELAVRIPDPNLIREQYPGIYEHYQELSEEYLRSAHKASYKFDNQREEILNGQTLEKKRAALIGELTQEAEEEVEKMLVRYPEEKRKAIKELMMPELIQEILDGIEKKQKS